MRYELSEIWGMNRGRDPWYSTLDPIFLSMPDCMLGLVADSAGNLFIGDVISESLVKVSNCGKELFRVGTIGNGPEDVQAVGEPIFWPGSHIAHVDYSMSSKVVCYDEEGKYLETIGLTGYKQYQKVVASNNVLMGVAVETEVSRGGGVTVRVELGCLDREGNIRDSMKLVEKQLPAYEPGTQYREDIFEVIPRLEIGPDGVIYVQNDPYLYQVDCYDRKLKHLGSIIGAREVKKRSRREQLERQKKIRGNILAAGRKHAISHMVPRDKGELWIRGGECGDYSGTQHIEFARYSTSGRSLGVVFIDGLPSYPGNFKVCGWILIWRSDDDYQEGDHTIPYIRVYRLVKSH